MTDVSAFLSKFTAIVRDDVGYKEGKNNANKFAGDVDAPNHAPYCAIGIMSAAHRAGVDLHKHFDTPWYVAGIYQQAKRNRWLTDSPRDGDLVIEDFGHAARTGEHIEVAFPSKGARKTVGYNTSSGVGGSQSNGDGVYERTRKAGDIVAYVSMRKVLASIGIGTAQEVPRGPVIRPGDRGTVVMDLQNKLVAKGAKIVPDGVYGPRTEAAVRSLQAAYGIAVDGVTGPQTFAALSAAPPVRSKLRKGDRSMDVKRLQNLLGIPADGVYGPQTDKAVRAFQSANGLGADGVVGPATWSALYGVPITC